MQIIPCSQTRAAALRAGKVDLIGRTYLAPTTPAVVTQPSEQGGQPLELGLLISSQPVHGIQDGRTTAEATATALQSVSASGS